MLLLLRRKSGNMPRHQEAQRRQRGRVHDAEKEIPCFMENDSIYGLN